MTSKSTSSRGPEQKEDTGGKRVLFTNCHLSRYRDGEYNKGSEAVMVSTLAALREEIPDAEYVSLVQYPEAFEREHGVRVVRNRVHHKKSFSLWDSVKSTTDLAGCILWRAVHNVSEKDLDILTRGRTLSEIRRADVIVDLSMDLYSDNLGALSIIEHSKELLCCILLKKPVVVYAQSLGPFRKPFTRTLARLTLDHVSLITVREELAMEYLKETGVTKTPIYLTADPAFLMEPAGKERAREILREAGIDPGKDRPLVGLTITPTIIAKAMEKKGKLRHLKNVYTSMQYVLPEKVMDGIDRIIRRTGYYREQTRTLGGREEVRGIISHLTCELGATVVLIPHTITPKEDLGPLGDDRTLARQIYSKAMDRRKLGIIDGEYGTQEIKAVIGECDMLIGAKMHANIAALSQSVPVVGISYSHKFKGIMETLGMGDYVCEELDASKVNAAADRAWNNREDIKEKLTQRLVSIRERSKQNARLVRELLESINDDTGRSTEPAHTPEAGEERAPLPNTT